MRPALAARENHEPPELEAGQLGDQSDLATALRAAVAQLDASSTAEGAPRPLVVLLTDHTHDGADAALVEAERLKQRADLLVVALGPWADIALLHELAAGAGGVWRSGFGGELSRLFEALARSVRDARAEHKEILDCLRATFSTGREDTDHKP